jgi:uncharacterized integral membrane protein
MMEGNLPESGAANSAASGRNGPNVMLILLGIVAAVCIIFFLQNSELTRIDLLVFEWTTTIRWSILMAIALGVLLDRSFSLWWKRRGDKK